MYLEIKKSLWRGLIKYSSKRNFLGNGKRNQVRSATHGSLFIAFKQLVTCQHFSITTLSIDMIRMKAGRHYTASCAMSCTPCPAHKTQAVPYAWPPQRWKQGGGGRTTKHRFSRGLISTAVSSISCKHFLIYIIKKRCYETISTMPEHILDVQFRHYTSPQ